MGLTTDPKDPRLGHGVDAGPIPQHDVYLVLSEDERAKGFIRPVRQAYIHVGIPGPQHLLRDLTEQESERYSGVGYVKFEVYPESESSSTTGRFWKQAELDCVGVGCRSVTTMGLALAETYARDIHFYGATFCVACSKHLPVGKMGEFMWMEGSTNTGIRVGT